MFKCNYCHEIHLESSVIEEDQVCQTCYDNFTKPSFKFKKKEVNYYEVLEIEYLLEILHERIDEGFRKNKNFDKTENYKLLQSEIEHQKKLLDEM